MIEQLSKIFTKAAEGRRITIDPPHKQADHTADSIHKTPQTGRTEYNPLLVPHMLNSLGHVWD